MSPGKVRGMTPWDGSEGRDVEAPSTTTSEPVPSRSSRPTVIRRLICRLLGHRWWKEYPASDWSVHERCDRCGLRRPVETGGHHV